MKQINPFVQRNNGNAVRTSSQTASVLDADGNSVFRVKASTRRRGFKTFALQNVELKTGKFYYEMEVGNNGGHSIDKRGWYPQLGWTDVELFAMKDEHSGVGDDAGCSWGIDGERAKFWVDGKHTGFLSKFKWKTGTVVGCFLTLDADNRSNNCIVFVQWQSHFATSWR